MANTSTNSERASEYVINRCRYYPQGLPPTRAHYAVSYRGKALVSNDTYDLVQRLQAIMDSEDKE